MPDIRGRVPKIVANLSRSDNFMQFLKCLIFTTEATINIKRFERQELVRMEKIHMRLATIADGKTTASWGEKQNNFQNST